MRILICGDRNWTDYDRILTALSCEEGNYFNSGPNIIIECVIEGEAQGADKMGRLAAEELGIPVLQFPAKWNLYGHRAGPIRNQQMLDEGKPTQVWAFHNNIQKSIGTKDMIRRANKAGILVILFTEKTLTYNFKL